MEQRERISWTEVIILVTEYIALCESSDYHEDRAAKYDSWIAEAAIEAVYGPEIWEWLNDRIL